MATRASAASESPWLAASSTNCRFSSGVSRTVRVGSHDRGTLVTRDDPLVLHNADRSLSCHQQNTHSKMPLRV
jgi:anti-sigma factor RsiW